MNGPAIERAHGRNRVLSAFAGLAAVSLFGIIQGSVLSLLRGSGLMNGWDMDAVARIHSQIDVLTLLAAAFGAITVGWWLCRQGSVVWGVSALAVAGLCDAFVRTMAWLGAMNQTQAELGAAGVLVTYFPSATPVLIIAVLVLLGAGLQRLKEKLKP